MRVKLQKSVEGMTKLMTIEKTGQLLNQHCSAILEFKKQKLTKT